MTSHVLAMAAALLLDRLIGDPRRFPHPVRWIGTFIAYLDRKWNKGSRRIEKGVLMLVTVLLSTAAAAAGLIAAARAVHPFFAFGCEVIIIWASIAPRSLKEAGMEVYQPLVDGNLPEARKKLSWIVGRDTDQLDESGITRGAVETVAENTSDGVIAPLFWALIGGGPAAFLYRAVNTCDSMVGYKNEKYEQFGKASARFDDAVNWIPARLTAVLLVAAAYKRAPRRQAWQIVQRDARKHPSPNSGWCEAAVAGLLNIELGGVNTYKGVVSNRARMGDPLEPCRAVHILQAAALMERAVYLLMALLLIGVIVYEVSAAWR